MIDPNTLEFLKNLSQNNNKEWFSTHRIDYDQSKQDFITLCSTILEDLKLIQSNLFNTNVKKCILRINRDIRFSKDKRPYKSYFGAGFGPGGKSSGKVDFYMQIQPNGESFIGAGMWEPGPKNLAKFRQEIDYSPDRLKSIIENEKFRKHFPIVEGARLKTKPRGYEIDHPEIDLLRYKELFFIRKFSDKEVCSPQFKNVIVESCKKLKPYQDYLNELFFEA